MLTFLLLLLAVLALLSGPVAYRFAERSRSLRAAVDGFSIITVASLALLDLAPHALAEAGLVGIIPLVIGFALPTWFHRQEGLGRFSDHVLVFSLVLHSAVEAAALGSAPAPQAHALGLAILAHQLPVGLAAYSVSTSRRTGWLIIIGLAIAMVAGFSSGRMAANFLPTSELAWLEALAAGSLLHVLSEHEYDPAPNYPVQNVQRHLARLEPGVPTFEVPQVSPIRLATLPGGHAHAARSISPPAHEHSGHTHGHAHGGHAHGHGGHAHGGLSAAGLEETPHPSGFWSALFHTTATSRSAGLGALLGLLLVLIHPDEHGSEEPAHFDFLGELAELSLASAPAVLLGYLLAGAVALIVSERGTAYLKQGSRLRQALKAVMFGLPLPICSCGVLPVYESLVRRGVPLAAGIAFLVATPELGLDAALLSWPLLGWQIAVARLVAAFFVALAASLIVSRFAERTAVGTPELLEAARRPSPQEAFRFGLVEMFDHTMPWILFGLVIAALSAPLWHHPWLKTVPDALQVPLFALIGLPLYVCASGATPLAAVALQAGVSPGAAIAFLLTGPATNTTTFAILARLHGKRVALLFGASVAGLATLSGYAINFMSLTLPPPLAEAGHADGSWLNKAALVLLVFLTLLSLLRQGPRGMLGQVTHALH
jgi:uncharacterized protein